MKHTTIRTICIVVFLLVTFFYLSPLFLPKDVDPVTGVKQLKKPIPFWTEKMLKLGLDLEGGMEVTLYVDLDELPSSEHEQAVKAAVEIIRNRIDQFGVAEPSIQRVGKEKIVIQLPGLKDRDRAKDLIGKTAELKFQLVANPDEAQRVISHMDIWLSQNYHKFDFLRVLDFGHVDTRMGILDNDEDDEFATREWHSDIMSYLVSASMAGFSVNFENIPVFRQLLNEPEVQNAMLAGFRIVPGKEVTGATRADLPVYVLYDKAELTGSYLTNAETRFSTQNDFTGANRPYVSLRFSREGARIFERVTAQHIRRQLAIVLDDVVYVAPTIQDRIRGGEAQITGAFTLNECNDIVIVLKAGNLPAPVRIGEERTVGPTLGSDSIRKGTRAGIIGISLVLLFMVAYYKLAGLIADLALLLNTAFIFAALTFFEATLTLPGIAGIILGISMAVDANVLIYERIKDELKTGKSIRNAIDAGYKRATITILDANLTSLIICAVLYQFGSGPIRGFAITLAIGISASMFTAIVMTRAIFDTFITHKTTKLSI
jgi:protein-export membrane protein SecD